MGEASSIISDRDKSSELKRATRTDGIQVKAAAAENPADIAQVLSDVQIEHAQIKFSQLDKDGSGTIEYKELKGVLKELGISMSKKEFQKKMKGAFKQADTSGDNKLDFEEFKTMYNFIYVTS